MKILNNTTHLTTSVLAVLACASFVGCTRAADRSVLNDNVERTTTEVHSTTTQTTAPVVTQDTASNTTVAVDDTNKPMNSAASNDNSSVSATNSTKHLKAKHKVRKHGSKRVTNDAAVEPPYRAPVVVNEDETYGYDYDSDVARTDRGAVDATPDYDETVSGTTQAMQYRETGLSPFAQEPNSRIPATIGSGQLTGEDKSTTILEGPSLFQDPSALGRDLIK